VGDLLQQGAEWLEGQRHEHLSHAVTYHRGNEVVELRATVGRTEFEVEREFGVEKVESRDFLIRSADLVLGAQISQPQRGDRIREPIGDQVVIFEVMAPGDEPPWRYSDPGRRTMRIHTKQVDVQRLTEQDLDQQRGLVCRHFRVIYTRPTWGGRTMRHRECRHCGRRMTTWEKAGG
jgi:hypothetical protein